MFNKDLCKEMMKLADFSPQFSVKERIQKAREGVESHEVGESR
jgi:hypothetical protein